MNQPEQKYLCTYTISSNLIENNQDLVENKINFEQQHQTININHMLSLNLKNIIRSCLKQTRYSITTPLGLNFVANYSEIKDNYKDEEKRKKERIIAFLSLKITFGSDFFPRVCVTSHTTLSIADWPYKPTRVFSACFLLTHTLTRKLQSQARLSVEFLWNGLPKRRCILLI